MSKHAVNVANNANRENNKAAGKALAKAASLKVDTALRTISRAAFAYAGAGDVVKEAYRAGIATKVDADVLAKAFHIGWVGRYLARLAKVATPSDVEVDAYLARAERIVGLKSADHGTSDAYRSAGEQAAYNASRKALSRLRADMTGKKKTVAPKASTANETKPETSTDNVVTFQDYVKQPHKMDTAALVTYSHNLAALIGNVQKTNAKEMPAGLAAIYAKFAADVAAWEKANAK